MRRGGAPIGPLRNRRRRDVSSGRGSPRSLRSAPAAVSERTRAPRHARRDRARAAWCPDRHQRWTRWPGARKTRLRRSSRTPKIRNADQGRGRGACATAPCRGCRSPRRRSWRTSVHGPTRPVRRRGTPGSWPGMRPRETTGTPATRRSCRRTGSRTGTDPAAIVRGGCGRERIPPQRKPCKEEMSPPCRSLRRGVSSMPLTASSRSEHGRGPTPDLRRFPCLKATIHGNRRLESVTIRGIIIIGGIGMPDPDETLPAGTAAKYKQGGAR